MRNSLGRSAAWTALLEQGFFEGLTADAASELTTEFVNDFYASLLTDMWTFAKTWTPKEG